MNMSYKSSLQCMEPIFTVDRCTYFPSIIHGGEGFNLMVLSPCNHAGAGFWYGHKVLVWIKILVVLDEYIVQKFLIVYGAHPHSW